MDDMLQVLHDMEKRLEGLSHRLDMADASIRSDLAVLQADLQHVREMSMQYVTRAEHDPVRDIAFGLVALVMVSVVGAVLALVVGK